MTALHVQTRGRPRHRDYAFLGTGPGQPWWRAYAGHTAFERPTVLVESDGAGYRAYLSGIPSTRRDAVGSVIRYTLVLEASSGAEAVGPDAVTALVACWLADQAGGGAGAVSRALDAEFPEDEVERMLGAPEPAVPVEVQRRVAAAVGSLVGPGAAPQGEPGTPTSWLGDAAAPRALAAFVATVAELVRHKPGRALLLNLVGSAEDLGGLLADDRPLAVLVPDLGTTGLTPLGPRHPEPAEAVGAEPDGAEPDVAADGAESIGADGAESIGADGAESIGADGAVGKALPSAALAPPRTAAEQMARRIPPPRVLAPMMLLLSVTIAVLVPLILLVIPILLLINR